MAFCVLLIEWRIFDVVTLSFLPLGHGHNDVDHKFSLVAKPFFDASVQHFEDFEKLCYQHVDNLQLEWVTEVYDWVSWLTPYMHTFKGHKKPLAFHFQRDPGTEEVLIQAFAQFPINPVAGTGDVILAQIPPNVPHRLQPHIIPANVKQDTAESLNVLFGSAALKLEYEQKIQSTEQQVIIILPCEYKF